MNQDRLKIIVNNLLDEICEKVWEAPAEGYIPWLKEEIGLTDEEITELKDSDCFREPVSEIER